MKFKTGQPVEFVKRRPPLPLRLRLRLRPPLPLRLRPRPRLRPGDLLTVIEAIEAKDAFEKHQEADPNCYIVFSSRHEKEVLVYENEVK